MAKQIRLEGLTKQFGDIVAVEDVDLTIPAGEFVTLVGPSGSGKTTLLRMIAGLETPTSGRIYFDEEDMTDTSPQKRPLSMVFQNIALYPHMSCRENIGYGLKIQGIPAADRNERIEEAARILQIEDQLDKRPADLSGGQQQRVALGRAFVEDPEVLLFDEPMSDLDAKLKEDLRTEFQRLHRRLESTFVYVTHDQNEAMTMSDKIAVMNVGRVEQFDTPESIFHDPVSEYVATFIGTPSTNVIECTVEDGIATGDGIRFELPEEARGRDRVRVGIRPQYLQIGSGGDVEFDVIVEVVEPIGTEYVVHAITPEDELSIEIVSADVASIAPDDRITVSMDVDRVYFFDVNGDRIRTDTHARSEQTTGATDD